MGIFFDSHFSNGVLVKGENVREFADLCYMIQYVKHLDQITGFAAFDRGLVQFKRLLNRTFFI